MSGTKMNKVIEILYIVIDNSSLDFKEDITPETHLRNDIGLDSIALAELAVRIEEEFDVDVFEEGLVNTVDEVLQRI